MGSTTSVCSQWRRSTAPILVTMFLCNTPVTFEVDTGAAVTVMSGESFHQLLPGHTLHPSSVELKTYTGEPMKVIGETRVDISYQSQEVNSLSLVVVEGSGPSLLGRNWLHHITLDWSNIRTVLLEKDELRKLLQEYAEVFSDELGTITPVKAKLEVSPSAVPRFHRPRPVAYALKPLVEQELDRLEQAGVLERVDYSDWAAPIVTVPKRDGCVRICGDYKVTINPALDIDQYPLPRPEDLFATLAGGNNPRFIPCLQPTRTRRRRTTVSHHHRISPSTPIAGCIGIQGYHLW